MTTKARKLIENLIDAEKNVQRAQNETYLEVPIMESPHSFITARVDKAFGLNFLHQSGTSTHLSAEHAAWLGRWLIEMFEDDEEHKEEAKNAGQSTVSIPKERYLELLNAEEELGCLNAGGVDNWEGCGEAMEGCQKAVDLDERGQIIWEIG